MPSQKDYKNRIQSLLNKPENQYCCDCSDKKPTYAIILTPPPSASTTLGAFICYQCSAAHKLLGKQICKVRNVNHDDCKYKILQIVYIKMDMKMFDGISTVVLSLSRIWIVTSSFTFACLSHLFVCLIMRVKLVDNRERKGCSSDGKWWKQESGCNIRR